MSPIVGLWREYDGPAIRGPRPAVGATLILASLHPLPPHYLFLETMELRITCAAEPAFLVTIAVPVDGRSTPLAESDAIPRSAGRGGQPARTGRGRPANRGRGRGLCRDRRSSMPRAWAARERVRSPSPTKIVGPEPVSGDEKLQLPSSSRRGTPTTCQAANPRGQAVLQAVRRGRPVAVVPPLQHRSPAPSGHRWAFNARAMLPPSPEPAAVPRGCGAARCRLGGHGRGQDHLPSDDLPLPRPFTDAEAGYWGAQDDLAAIAASIASAESPPRPQPISPRLTNTST